MRVDMRTDIRRTRAAHRRKSLAKPAKRSIGTSPHVRYTCHRRWPKRVITCHLHAQRREVGVEPRGRRFLGLGCPPPSLCVHTCLDMCTDMYAKQVLRRVLRHVCGHVFRHVRRHVCMYMCSDMCLDMCLDMGSGMCFRHVFRHAGVVSLASDARLPACV